MAVERQLHVEIVDISDFVQCHKIRPERTRSIKALAEQDHLVCMFARLNVTRRKIVEDGKSSDVIERFLRRNTEGFLPDHDAELDLVVQLLGKVRYRDRCAGCDNARRCFQKTRWMLEMKITPVMCLPFRCLPCRQLREMTWKIARGMHDFSGTQHRRLQLGVHRRKYIRVSGSGPCRQCPRPLHRVLAHLQKGDHRVRQFAACHRVEVEIASVGKHHANRRSAIQLYFKARQLHEILRFSKRLGFDSTRHAGIMP